MARQKKLLSTYLAWLPIAMSATALSILFLYLAIYGVVQDQDEGIAAHMFQLLIAGQIPIIGYFIVKYISIAPWQVARIALIQIIAMIVALIPVYILEL